MSALFKKTTYQAVQAILDDKMAELNETSERLSQSKNSESKSTAGDKHETGRAMMHLEEEKLSRQMTETTKLRNILAKLDPTIKCETAVLGALIDTSKGWFYLSVGLGNTKVGDDSVVVISLGSPIGHLFFGTQAGDSFTFNGNKFDIVSVY